MACGQPMWLKESEPAANLATAWRGQQMSMVARSLRSTIWLSRDNMISALKLVDKSAVIKRCPHTNTARHVNRTCRKPWRPSPLWTMRLMQVVRLTVYRPSWNCSKKYKKLMLPSLQHPKLYDPVSEVFDGGRDHW